jgi:uncharacterized membrane protein YoaK (UPF0700 family)
MIGTAPTPPGERRVLPTIFPTPDVFIAQAHSFQQQARLAITLAWVAGYTNLIAVLTCSTAISHISGTASSLGRDVAEGRWDLALFAGHLLVTFLVGAMLAGLLTETARRRGWESIYVAPMLVEVVLLGAFAVGVEMHELRTPASGLEAYVLTGLASAAMGLQNATITRISNGVVRTTHVTGVLTDVGLELARAVFWLAGHVRRGGGPGGVARALAAQPGARQGLLLLSIFGSFVLGAFLAALVHEPYPRWSMFPPVAFLLWLVYVDATKPIAEIEPSDLVAQDLGLPPEIGVYHLLRDRDRRTGVQRLPDMAAWADRLPERLRVVVLDLDEVAALNDDATYQLLGAMERLRLRGRKMVVAGLGRAEFERLDRAGAWRDGHLACPDLEIAIARAMNLLDPRA